MNEDEKEIVFLLNEVYAKYSALQVQHHSDMDEFVNALHILQHLVMIRGVRRSYPDIFPLNLKVEAEMKSLGDTESIRRAIQETLDNALNGK